MQGKLFALGLLALAQGALAADAGEFSLGVGFNYSTGEDGTSPPPRSCRFPSSRAMTTAPGSSSSPFPI